MGAASAWQNATSSSGAMMRRVGMMAGTGWPAGVDVYRYRRPEADEKRDWMTWRKTGNFHFSVRPVWGFV